MCTKMNQSSGKEAHIESSKKIVHNLASTGLCTEKEECVGIKCSRVKTARQWVSDTDLVNEAIVCKGVRFTI